MTTNGKPRGSNLDARSLSAVLVHGSSEARFRLAEGLADSDGDVLSILAVTVRSDEDWLLRARCLEVLGQAASLGGEARAKEILQVLTMDGTSTEGARR
jgi:hypothetical protein